MADDDEDCLLFQEALEESSLEHDLRCFANGKELMDYLRRCGECESVDEPRPDLVILDLNMPIKDGRTALLIISVQRGFHRAG
jgi:CheY-like chemotaxis protein